ncbi:hypothetical protein AVEN_41893-1 [Araneus ventricosus]|uniref:Uncharacterized protein n=1 Tax=Araneus ventricosus TaxID=182803 RepID=A0A4Y2AEZ5_ARAVE|nr:hypothetical protein AVEN_41893-1 [Araneus ventricosus]
MVIITPLPLYSKPCPLYGMPCPHRADSNYTPGDTSLLRLKTIEKGTKQPSVAIALVTIIRQETVISNQGELSETRHMQSEDIPLNKESLIQFP